MISRISNFAGQFIPFGNRVTTVVANNEKVDKPR